MLRQRVVHIGALLALIGLGICGPASAHHSFARFDRCHLFTLAGDIQGVKWRNPHVEIDMRAIDGNTYTVIWLSLVQLKRDGVDVGVLKAGDRIQITGAKQPEDSPHVVALLTQIWRPKDGWRWSQPPQGC